MSKIYFTADTHFGSERSLALSRRPFSTTKQMDQTIIKNWNDLVKPEDQVYHLGDFGNYKIRDQLNGTIHLILGNYERKDIENGNISMKDLIETYHFNTVLENTIITIQNIDFFCVHEPSNCKKDQWNLFGHIHGRQLCKRYGLDVGTDGHHFYPIDEDTVVFYKNAIQNFYDENVFN